MTLILHQHYFPHITNTLKHNTHTNYINIPKPTNHPQRLYTDNFTHNLIQPNINNLNTNLLKINRNEINRNEINRTEIPNRNVYNNHFSPINLNYNNIPQPITFLKHYYKLDIFIAIPIKKNYQIIPI